MANVLTRNPIVIDTAGASALLTGRMDVIKIRWVAPSASAGNQVDIQDSNGVTSWESVATGNNYVESESWPHDYPLPMQGLLVPTLGSGTVYIYLKERYPPTA